MPEIPKVVPPKIATLLKKVDGLPTLPALVGEIARVLSEPAVSMPKVAAVVEKDPGMTAKVLKVANSTFYGFAGKISTIQLACSLLGMNTVEGLVSSVGVMQALRVGADAYFDPLKFWTHSLVTGLCAQEVATRLQYNLRGDVFTCGILHDIGKIVVAHSLRGDFVSVVELTRARVAYRQAERQVLGADHTQIGYWIGKHWGLPEVFLQCILNHHDWPEKREDAVQRRIAAIFLGNLVAHMAEYRVEKRCYPVIKPEMQQRLGMTQEIAIQTVEAALERANQILPEMMGGKK